jgi:excisionase family DNA binding protein
MERNTMAYTLTEAATATGLSRSTIFRAIKSGRISATRIEGNFSIEPAELHRVFPEKRAGNDAANQDAIAAALPDTALIAQLESEIRSLRGMSALMEERFHEMRDDRDAWRQQAQQVSQQLALPLGRPEPQVQQAAQPFGPPIQQASDQVRARRWWWRRSA